MPKTTISSPDSAAAVDRLTLLAADARDGVIAGWINTVTGCACMADE